MDFKGKKITVMGLGLLGRGVGDIAYLAERGGNLIVTDLKSQDDLASSIEQLKKFPDIKYTLGKHELSDFEDRDFILKAAGVPFDSEYITHAREKGIPIKMSTALFAKNTPATIVGITGTRGKSTTTFLIHHVLTEALKGSDRKVFLGGNVRGVSTLPFIDEAGAGDIAVLELDSWQLQGFGEEKLSPHISVFTTFMDDHLNYYRSDSIIASRDLYFNDKANIYRNQKEDDVLVVGEDISEKVSDAISKVVVAKRENVPSDWKIHIPGEHNKLNIACAIEALRAMGIEEEEIKNGIESFSGVEGRLQKIKEIHPSNTLGAGSIEIWNDNNSTTPDATIAALKALAPKPVVLIMGGADKNIDMSGLVSLIKGSTKKLILLPGTGTDRLLRDYQVTGRDIEKVLDLDQAVEIAVASATEGDAILFSPAFASFGLFKNEYDRNDQFVALINSL
jgi:UDP-N-acetylmuramoylalanine--D-glutamate ligase